MADDNKPQGNEGGDNGQQTEPAKEVVSYAKYKRETDEYQEQVKALKAELEQRDKQIEEFTSKAGNAEELQAALDKAKADNEAYKAGGLPCRREARGRHAPRLRHRHQAGADGGAQRQGGARDHPEHR